MSKIRITFIIEENLWNDFKAACMVIDKPTKNVLGDFMRIFAKTTNEDKIKKLTE